MKRYSGSPASFTWELSQEDEENAKHEAEATEAAIAATRMFSMQWTGDATLYDRGSPKELRVQEFEGCNGVGWGCPRVGPAFALRCGGARTEGADSTLRQCPP